MRNQQNSETSDPQITLGTIGCGAHCLQSHLHPSLLPDNASVGAIYDLSKEAIQNLARISLKPAAIFESEEALIQSSVDAILVMSPDQFHAESLIRIVRARKHVFVEKPLATTQEELEEVMAALKYASEHNVVVSSCHPQRFDPPYVWVKENLPSLVAQLGPVSHFEFDFSYHRPSERWKLARSLLLDHANHEVDLVHWYFGHNAFSASKLPDGAEHYHVVGKRDDNITFAFNGTRYLDTKVYREFMRIRFHRGSLSLDVTEGHGRIDDHGAKQTSEFRISGTDYDKRFRLVNENFIDAVRGNGPNYLSTQDLYVNTAIGVYLTSGESWRYEGAGV